MKTQEIIKAIADNWQTLEQMLKAAPTRREQRSYSDETYYEVPNNPFYRSLTLALPHTNYGWRHSVPKHEYPGDYSECECGPENKCPKTFEMNYSYGIGD